jgi:hypothetical protein
MAGATVEPGADTIDVNGFEFDLRPPPGME